MKLKDKKTVEIEISIDELRAIKKMIGETSRMSRIEDFHLTRDESELMFTLFLQLCNILGEDE